MKHKTSSSCSTINVYYQNVRGLRTKLKHLTTGIPTNNADIYALTETWLNEDIYDSELGFNKFNVFRTDRSKDTSNCEMGGGVLIAVNKSIQSSQVHTKVNNIESVYVNVKVKCYHFIVGLVYLPPRSTTQTISNYLEELDEVQAKYPQLDILLCGDYNLRNLIWQSDGSLDLKTKHSEQSAILYSNLCFYHNFKQLSSVLNSKQVQLDLVFSNIEKVNVSHSIDPLPINIDIQHPPLDICITVPSSNRKRILKSKDTNVFCYKNGEYSKIADSLNLIDWNHDLHNCATLDDALCKFYSILNESIEKYIPVKKIRDLRFPIWASKELKNLIFEKKVAHKMYKSTGQFHFKTKFKQLRTKCKDLSDKNYKHYVHEQEKECKQNPRKFWSFVNNKKQTLGLPLVLQLNSSSSSDGDTIVNMFAENFSENYSSELIVPQKFEYNHSLITPISNITIPEHEILKALNKLKLDSSPGPDNVPPIVLKKCSHALVKPLHILFNWSLTKGVYPMLWKSSYIIPIHKNGVKTDVKNYRPISKMSSIPKVFEHLLYKELSPMLSSLLVNEQHGFVTKKSTTTNLLSFSQQVTEALGDEAQFDCIVTDYSKAFDKVNLNLLIEKLRAFGISDPLLSWFLNYLTIRKQIVKYKSTYNHEVYYSKPFDVLSGCPQGGHMSGLLFNLFINDISNFLNVQFWLFADDKKIGQKITNVTNCEQLQNDLNVLFQWCETNRMDLNINKCKVITFHRNKNPIYYPYHINNSPLTREYQIKDLGVTMTSQLDFKPHYEIVKNKAMKSLGFINRNSQEFQLPDTYKTLYCTYVRPKIEYAATIWSPYYQNNIKTIESVQRKFLRSLAFKQHKPVQNHDYTDILKHNNMVTLEDRRKIQDMVLLLKLLNYNINLPEILEKIDIKARVRPTRNINNFLSIKTQSKNYLFNSPLHRMVHLMNQTIDKDPTIDLFYMNQNQFKSKVYELIHNGN